MLAFQQGILILTPLQIRKIDAPLGFLKEKQADLYNKLIV